MTDLKHSKTSQVLTPAEKAHVIALARECKNAAEFFTKLWGMEGIPYRNSEDRDGQASTCIRVTGGISLRNDETSRDEREGGAP